MPSKPDAVTDAPRERNLKLVVQYDGTRYVGWERQKNGLAVQEVLEDAIFTISRQHVVIAGSGRTDAGVHALAQVASFRLQGDLHPRKLMLGLNAVTPPDVSVVRVQEVDGDFHARFSARRKWYRYSVLNDPAERPLQRLYSYHFPRPLDTERMSAAAQALVGQHDFRAFAREARLKKSCVRTILEARVSRDDQLVMFDFVGTGFLYNMVRILVGTLLEIGISRRSPGTLPTLLGGAERKLAGFTVPAHGLCLMQVYYSSDPTS